MYRLAPKHQQYLLNQPESGMGYQFVEIVTEAHRRVQAVVYNAELVIAANKLGHRRLFKRYLMGGASIESRGREVKGVRMLSQGTFDLRSFAVNEPRGGEAANSGPAQDAPVMAVPEGAAFKRFTAFVNDRRVRSDRSLLPGTYATTEADARHVRTGKAAVARYALPNPEPAVNVVTILPIRATPIQYGVVEPAHGQPGGGVEVIFIHGSQPGTVSGPVRIPPE